MKQLSVTALVFFALLFPQLVSAADSVPNEVQQPGTQPREIGNLESPDKCDNCHGGYNSAVEPAYNWRGSMMAHAGRDPIFWATLAIAEQDFDGAGDLCLRCHSTSGWLAGRSTPTDGSGLAAGDADGVDCDYCHKLTNPNDTEHQGLMNAPFVANDEGTGEGYYGSGMSSLWPGSAKLGPYNNAEARHQFMQSQFHRDRDFCGTCHDVSNPVTGDLAHNFGKLFGTESVVASGVPGSPVDGKAAFNNPPYRYGVVERTFSEYKSGAISTTKVDDFPNLPADLRGGALQAVYNATYVPARGTANYQNPTAVRYFSCQSCHMRAVTGTGANKNGVPVRTDLPLHDMTGGNYWMASAIDYLNARGKLRLGGGMSAARLQAMYDGALRALEQLQLAATLQVEGNQLRVINHTGHKLITGYPEGRRMWLNIRWRDADGFLLREDGRYGAIDVTINGVARTVRSILDLGGANTRVYEAHMGMTSAWAQQLLGLGYPADLALSFDRRSGDVDLTLGQLAAMPAGSAAETFHFALNNTVVSDNRIPPYRMSYDEARRRNASSVPANRYGGAAGGVYLHYDTLALNPPAGATSATIDLLYQPTSWEYIQFLNLANDGSNAFLGAEGANMLEAWLNTGMAEPVVMASATWGGAAPVCTLDAPTLLGATAGDKSVALEWSSPAAGVVGYSLYLDQSGKAQLVAALDCSAGECTRYTATGLTNGQKYCYKVTARDVACESAFSNILCATPQPPGQPSAQATVFVTDIGRWLKQGKGGNATFVWDPTTEFTTGDEVVLKLKVTDQAGAAVAGAAVSVSVNGPAQATLTSSASRSDGFAEARWTTQKPNKQGAGGTATGLYTATVTGLSSNSHQWDGGVAQQTFTLGN